MGLRVFIIIRYYGFWFFKLEYGGGGGYFVKLVKVINILILNVMFKGFNLCCLFMLCFSKYIIWINVNRIC